MAGALKEHIAGLQTAKAELEEWSNTLEHRVKERTRELEKALAEVKTLSGMLPICASCKKIRDDQGYWEKIETYISQHSGATFSHGICPECLEQLYPGVMKDEKK